MNILNKLFEVMPLGYFNLKHIYFTQDGFYGFLFQAHKTHNTFLRYYSKRQELWLKNYDEWTNGIKSFFKSGVDMTWPELSYKETLLETLLTSKHKEWGDFARKRLLK